MTTEPRTDPTPRSPQTRPMTATEARTKLRIAWFESHPNQPMSEGRAQINRYFAAISAEAAAEALARSAAVVAALDNIIGAIERGDFKEDPDVLLRAASAGNRALAALDAAALSAGSET